MTKARILCVGGPADGYMDEVDEAPDRFFAPGFASTEYVPFIFSPSGDLYLYAERSEYWRTWRHAITAAAFEAYDNRPITSRPPAKEDADEYGMVLACITDAGERVTRNWERVTESEQAWVHTPQWRNGSRLAPVEDKTLDTLIDELRKSIASSGDPQRRKTQIEDVLKSIINCFP
jgi:hypothetical protein